MLKCDYSQCGICHYVGPEIQHYGTCPACDTRIGSAITVWPRVQWLSAAEDIQFLYEHKKLELLTIAVASYFEGVLHGFLYDAMLLVHPPTRNPEEGAFDNIEDELQKWSAGQLDYTQRIQVCEALLKKHRSWPGRLTDLCTMILGAPFDSLLAKHHSNHAQFITNRDNIHDWRNLILHRGVSLDEMWPEETRKDAPEIAVAFVKECWDVFRTMNNEEIHKPYRARRQAEKS